MKQTINLLILSICLCFASPASAQITLEDLKDLDIEKLLGKTKILSVEKGFNPIFKLGNNQINTAGFLGEKLKGVNILGEILDKRGARQIMGMYKTYKTGLVVFKFLGAAGTIVTIAGAVKGFTDQQQFQDQTVKQMLYPALTSIATGIITKIITKKASYKAVDIFNGVVRKTIKDFISINGASSTMGVGVYVKL